MGKCKKCLCQMMISVWLSSLIILPLPLLPQQFFQLEVYNSDGSRLTESQIHSQLLRIRSQSWKTDKEPVGILTSEHRHTWGQAYNRLLTGRAQNNGASTLIQHSVINYMHSLKSCTELPLDNYGITQCISAAWSCLINWNKSPLLCSFQLFSVYCIHELRWMWILSSLLFCWRC